MDNQAILDQFLQDVLKVNTDCVNIIITGFVDSFGVLISKTD